MPNLCGGILSKVGKESLEFESRVVDVESRVESSFLIQTTRAKSSLFTITRGFPTLHCQCLAFCDFFVIAIDLSNIVW